MPKPAQMLWLLTCALAICACTPAGKRPLPPIDSQPKLQPVPASLMQEPKTEQRVRAELFEQQPSATPKSEDSRPS